MGAARRHLRNTIARVSDALREPNGELAQHLSTEPVLNVDESGWKDRGLKYWIRIFCTSPITFFCIAKSRRLKVLKDVLAKAHGGTVPSDSFSPYVRYANRLQQSCLAHLIRNAKFLPTSPGQGDKRSGERLLVEFRRLFHFGHLRARIPKEPLDRIILPIRDRVLRLAKTNAPGQPAKPTTLARRLVKHDDAPAGFVGARHVPGGKQALSPFTTRYAENVPILRAEPKETPKFIPDAVAAKTESTTSLPAD